jgi:uncharacterized protein YdaU (DUF1376 family)
MTFYMFHIADFYAATRHLTFEERAIYRELLDIYYDTEKPLTLDLDKLARLVCCRTPETRASLEGILKEFFSVTADGYRSSRADEEIARYYDKRDSLKARAEKRWKKPDGKSAPPEECNGNAVAVLQHQSSTAAVEQPDAAVEPSPSSAMQLQLQVQLQREEPPLPPKRGGSSLSPLSSWSELPEGFDSEEFRAQWVEFLNYRKELRKPLRSKRSELMIWENMKKHGLAQSLIAIRRTIQNGWQGVFFDGADKPLPATSGASQRAARASREHIENDYALPEL